MTNRLASALSLALVLMTVSCDDDDAPAKIDSGILAEAGAAADTGAAGDAPPAAGQCVGTFAQLTQTQLMAVVAAKQPPGKCASASDVNLICTKSISDIAGACGVTCVGMGEACIKSCVKSQVALSDDCNGCYAQTVQCAQTMCLSQCLADPRAAACTQCQIDKGCRSTFFACSGLPGGAPAGDGGVVDGAVTTDGAATTDTAVTADTAVTVDVAVTPDAGAPDASSVDAATSTPDAGAVDGSASDA